MVILMTNDNVSVYDMSESDFENILKSDDSFRTLASYHKIYDVPKRGFSLEKMKNQLDGKIDSVKSYYCDNGDGFVKKYINNLDEIKYYEDGNGELYPSDDYKEDEPAKVNLEWAQLIALDNQLNTCNHIENLLPPHLVPQFKRLYGSSYYRKLRAGVLPTIEDEEILDSFYDVDSYSKLIIKNTNEPLTPSNIEGYIFLTVIPVGINVDGKCTYCVEEYRITKQDIEEIRKIYMRYLYKDRVKVGDLTENEKFRYLDGAVREYRKALINDLSGVGMKNRTPFNSKLMTWSAYKGAFLNKFGYVVGDFDDTWVKFDSIRVDGRVVQNGFIVPVTIMNYQKEKKLVQTNDYDDSMTVDEIDDEPLMENGAQGEDLFKHPDVLEFVDPVMKNDNITEFEDSSKADDTFAHPDVLSTINGNSILDDDPFAQPDVLLQKVDIKSEQNTAKEEIKSNNISNKSNDLAEPLEPSITSTGESLEQSNKVKDWLPQVDALLLELKEINTMINNMYAMTDDIKSPEIRSAMIEKIQNLDRSRKETLESVNKRFLTVQEKSGITERTLNLYMDIYMSKLEFLGNNVMQLREEIDSIIVSEDDIFPAKNFAFFDPDADDLVVSKRKELVKKND